MKENFTEDISVGKYRGLVAEKYKKPEFIEAFERVKEIVRSSKAQVISSGRNVNVKVNIAGQDLVIKSFGRQSYLKDRADGVLGGKARRTWQAATALSRNDVGTPCPVVFLEYRQNGRFLESYYISEFESDVISFGHELTYIYRKEPECEKMMILLETVASAVRQMHEAGVQHNDLGNQNILLCRADEPGWGKVSFIDLNRAKLRNKLTEREKARDISRLNIPSELLRVFKDMYYGGAMPPENFHKWESFYRKRYAIHCATRNLRHPVRWLSGAKDERGETEEVYPDARDMWIWDERSGQPINVLGSKDRNKLYSKTQFWRIVWATITASPKVLSEYKKLLLSCYQGSVELKGKIGIAIEPKAETLEHELDLLNKLGNVPVIIRFYHHKGKAQWDFAADVAGRLAGEGRKVTAALVQDRESSKNAALWEEFLLYVIEKTSGSVEDYELGHAINRVKWGIWDLREYRRIADVAAKIIAEKPELRFIGPAVIDFEYPFLLAALRVIPYGLNFGALSHHLYVDRRGAPENKQGAFSALEKFALAKAIGRYSERCVDKLIVSEVNWPLNGAGVYSPVCSPYESPQQRETDPTVSEDDYCDYMLRYILIAICSGMVERVYWWRLVARGYGLVDDTDSGNWTERPAFKALAHFMGTLGGAVFESRDAQLESQDSGIRAYKFDADGKVITVVYTLEEKAGIVIPFEYYEVTDVAGEKIDVKDSKFELTGRPVYIYAGN